AGSSGPGVPRPGGGDSGRSGHLCLLAKTGWRALSCRRYSARCDLLASVHAPLPLVLCLGTAAALLRCVHADAVPHAGQLRAVSRAGASVGQRRAALPVAAVCDLRPRRAASPAEGAPARHRGCQRLESSMENPPSVTPAPAESRQYFERAGSQLRDVAHSDPVCLYLETTNRCNLLCTTCPRTLEALAPPADMSWELFPSIVDQFPRIERVVLHGVGEPMMVRGLPRMIRYLKDRGTYVLFNTNGTLL